MYEKVEREIDDKRLARKINEEMDAVRPKWEDFNGMYPLEQIREDKQKLAEYRERKGYDSASNKEKLTDGILVEKLFCDAEKDDLFGEWDLYDILLTDEADTLLYTFPAHEYDDTFNNVDIVCVVKNALTGHNEMPFAVDCTSNAFKVEEKMNYKRTDKKIKGFTELKYYRNVSGEFNSAKPENIPKVPRFVVGVSSELARDLYANQNEWTKDEIEHKKEMTRYFLLKELAIQAEDMGSPLSDYFTKLLQNFEENHDTSNYPEDPILEEIKKASMKMYAKTEGSEE